MTCKDCHEILKPLSYIDRGFRFYPLSCTKRGSWEFCNEVYLFLYGKPKSWFSVLSSFISLYMNVVTKDGKLWVYVKEQ